MSTEVEHGEHNRLIQGNPLMNKLCPRVHTDPFEVMRIIDNINRGNRNRYSRQHLHIPKTVLNHIRLLTCPNAVLKHIRALTCYQYAESSHSILSIKVSLPKDSIKTPVNLFYYAKSVYNADPMIL